MKILFLADFVFEDLPGGSRVVARELAAGLTSRGHEVTFLVRAKGADASSDTRIGGARVVRFAAPESALGYIKASRAACARLLSEESFDIAHTHFAYAGAGPLQAVPKSTVRVRTFHGPWDLEGWLDDTQTAEGAALSAVQRLKALAKRLGRREVERHSLKNSARVLTLSHCFADMAAAQYGVTQKQLALVPGGAEIGRFVLPSADKPALRRALGLPEDAEILLSIRRLAPRMGLDNLIEAMPEILAQCPNAYLVIGGKGPEEARLRQLIQTLGLGDKVKLAGFIPDGALVSYYQAADLFVLPTLALEGFGLVTTEALSCGLPVIGTPVGATPEILTPLDPRLIASGTTPSGLAAAVTGFLGSFWRSALTPAHLRSYVLQNYTWDRHVVATEQIYLELLLKPGRE